jgi:hypothetical protein
VLRKLTVAALIDTLCPPPPAHGLFCGRGVEALLLAILDGPHALYQGGMRLEERGMFPLLQPRLERTAVNDYRLGQILATLFATNLNRVFGAVALQALEGYAIAIPWLPQETTTIILCGAYDEVLRDESQSPQAPAAPLPPRPASGHSKDGRDALPQVLLSLGVRSDGGLPLRVGAKMRSRSRLPYLDLGLPPVRSSMACTPSRLKRSTSCATASPERRPESLAAAV